ncbi:MAG: TlpA family protein disulfide reductase [Defluviitaleaceae bacterium]|nr:TlpA family protein disulfide reductase [Defluviitaleaceae bacterium]MCL2264384.1 TlpA family protein disulfide reductase [Defluviitaleaceae bacterium]
MNKKISTVLAIIVFAALLGAAFFAYNALYESAYIPESTAETIAEHHGLPLAADFAMEDAYGNEVRLSDFRGQPVVLNFWTTWCPSCVRETPHFENLYQEQGDEIKILKVNLIGSRGETRESVDAFMYAGGYTLPLYFDTEREGARAYNITTIPATFFITADGYLATTIHGSVTETTLAHGVKTAIRNR